MRPSATWTQLHTAGRRVQAGVAGISGKGLMTLCTPSPVRKCHLGGVEGLSAVSTPTMMKMATEDVTRSTDTNGKNPPITNILLSDY